MAKPEYYYGVHSVESLLELEPERVLTLFTLKGRDDQRLQKILQLAEPFGISVQKQAVIASKACGFAISPRRSCSSTSAPDFK